MNTFKMNTGADVVYNWPSETGENNEWLASDKNQACEKTAQNEEDK